MARQYRLVDPVRVLGQKTPPGIGEAEPLLAGGLKRAGGDEEGGRAFEALAQVGDIGRERLARGGKVCQQPRGRLLRPG